MPQGTLSVTGELIDSNQSELEQFFQEVLAGFRFVVQAEPASPLD
jgi:hypothetical protein